MSSRTAFTWTSAWRACPALALSARTRDSRRLVDSESARLVELILELTVLERRLRVHAWVVLPGALHVVAACPRREDRARWPEALGRVKGLHARLDNRRLGRTGSAWRPSARVRPLSAEDAAAAVRDVEGSPRRAGLCRDAADWPHSSLRRRLAGPEARWLVEPPRPSG